MPLDLLSKVRLTISGIDILPTLLTTHYIVDLFALEVLPRRHLPSDGKLVGTSMTRPFVLPVVLDDEAVGACWTEEHGVMRDKMRFFPDVSCVQLKEGRGWSAMEAV